MYRSDLGLTDTFTYDKIGRLRTATFGTVGPGVSEQFVYDGTVSALWSLGNLTTRYADGASIPLDVNQATNRLTAAGYDALGNLTAWGWTGSAWLDNYYFDALSRRWRYYYSPNGLWEEYSYDASGERVARKTNLATVGIPSSDLRFFPIVPCRLLDTRNPNGPWGGPALNGQTERTFTATGQCGIPTTAKSLAANVTVVAPAYGGKLKAYASGLSFVPSIISNAFNAGNVRAVQGSVGIGGTGTDAGKFRLFADVPAGSTAHAIVDLFGYFAPNPSSPVPAGSSWFVTLRDEGSRLLTDYRYDWRTDLGTSVTSLLKDYVYLGNLLVATNTTTSSDGKPLGWVYQSNDHLGSPRMWTDVSRVTLATFRYRAFGLPMNTSQTPGQGPDFAGMEKDTSSGHHYDHARFYGSWISRFTSPDKVGPNLADPASFNRYAYARNNPLTFVDPDGDQVAVANTFRLMTDPSTQRVAQFLASGSSAAEAGTTAAAVSAAGGGLMLGGVFVAPLAASAAGEVGAVAGLSASVFRIGSIAERGRQIETALASAFGGALNRSFPVIDRFLNGVATSVKSVDLTASSYQNASRLSGLLSGYVDKLASFQGATFARQTVAATDITRRVLEVVIAKGAGSPQQLQAIENARRNALTVGVEFRVILAQ
jgi:RHS repeat-associated protein